MLFHAGISSTADILVRPPGAPLLPSGSLRGILYSGVRGQETGGKMTAAEIYESMDACLEENRGKDFRIVLLAVRAHAATLGWSVSRTADDILRFYFKMRHLGEH